MGFYIKKPIPVEAIQYTGENREEILDFTNGAVVFKDENGKKELLIRIINDNDIRVVPGCWIAKDIEGKYYPIQEEVFNKTYEERK